MGNSQSQKQLRTPRQLKQKLNKQRGVGLREKKDKYIREMLKEQHELSLRTTTVNSQLIFGQEVNIEQKIHTKWNEFSFQCFQSLVNARVRMLKEKQESSKHLEETELNFDKLRIKTFIALKNHILKIDSTLFEWQETPFYENYRLQQHHNVQQRINMFSDVLLKVQNGSVLVNKRFSTSTQSNLPGVDIRVSSVTKETIETADKQQTQKKILESVVKQIRYGEKQSSRESQDLDQRRSKSCTPITKRSMAKKQHPIHMIVTQFSKYLIQIYKPIISKYVLTLWNNDPDEKFLNVIANLEKNYSFKNSSFLQNSLNSDNQFSNAVRKTMYLSENGNQMLHELNEKFKHFHLYITDDDLKEESQFHNVLQAKAQEDVSQFLEIALTITAFFYRKTINIGIDIFASKIAEALTEVLFTVNDGGVFQIFLELYRLKHLESIRQLRNQFKLYNGIQITDFNTSLYQNLQEIQTVQTTQKEEQKPQIEEINLKIEQINPRKSGSHNKSCDKNSSYKTKNSNQRSECNTIFTFKTQIEMMKQIQQLEGPKEILDQFMKIYNSIGNQFQQYMMAKKKMEGLSISKSKQCKEEVMQADDFIAFLIVIIVKSECLDILPLIDLISAFTLSKRQKKFDYMKASLEGSIEFIQEEIGKYIQVFQEPAFELKSENELPMKDRDFQLVGNTDQSIRSIFNMRQSQNKKSFVEDAVNQFVSTHKDNRISTQIEKSNKFH